jgi:hypothetical protein
MPRSCSSRFARRSNRHDKRRQGYAPRGGASHKASQRVSLTYTKIFCTELLCFPRNRPSQIQLKQTPQHFVGLEVGRPAIGFGHGLIEQPVSFD